MRIQESVPLSSLTTFKIGGDARYVIECMSDDDIREAVAFAEGKQLPWFVFGEGSNVLAPDQGYDGIIIRVLAADVSITEEGNRVLVIADAGCSWDALVRNVSEKNLWGIENLAGIPGTVGAVPVQNIGAYGAEIADTLLWVEAMNPVDGTIRRFMRDECELGYRDSRFKRERLIILRVAFVLEKNGTPKLSYKELAALSGAGAKLDTPKRIADAVRGIRAKKFPDLKEWGTAGSFFKNPIITDAAYKGLQAKYPTLPGFPVSGGVKVPLAWILDNVLSLRGFRGSHTKLFEAQPLVVVAERGASAADIEAIAQKVAARVLDATGITLEWEVRKVG